MIHDKLENWPIYFTTEPWCSVFAFLAGLSATAEESSRISIQGDDIYAMIMSYQTCSPDESVLETHDEYIDIQMSLSNSEAIDWFYRPALEVKVPYDHDNDRTFYRRPDKPAIRINNFPGFFTVLYPEDAHMPKLVTGQNPEMVKKVVVKMRRSLVLANAFAHLQRD